MLHSRGTEKAFEKKFRRELKKLSDVWVLPKFVDGQDTIPDVIFIYKGQAFAVELKTEEGRSGSSKTKDKQALALQRIKKCRVIGGFLSPSNLPDFLSHLKKGEFDLIRKILELDFEKILWKLTKKRNRILGS